MISLSRTFPFVAAFIVPFFILVMLILSKHPDLKAPAMDWDWSNRLEALDQVMEIGPISFQYIKDASGRIEDAPEKQEKLVCFLKNGFHEKMDVLRSGSNGVLTGQETQLVGDLYDNVKLYLDHHVKQIDTEISNAILHARKVNHQPALSFWRRCCSLQWIPDYGAARVAWFNWRLQLLETALKGIKDELKPWEKLLARLDDLKKEGRICCDDTKLRNLINSVVDASDAVSDLPCTKVGLQKNQSSTKSTMG